MFRRHFNINRNDSVPSRNNVLLWVRNFWEAASAGGGGGGPGGEPSLRIHENIERLRQAFVRSPPRSASRNATALSMSDRTVRRILHEDLNFHPYKMVMVQALNDQYNVNRKTLSEVLLNALDNDDLNHILMTDEANFHLCGNVISQHSLMGNLEPSRYSPETFTFWEGYCLVWCSIFWGDRPLFLWRRGRQGSNGKFSPLTWNPSHFSGTGVAKTWCWNPESLVSAKWGNGSHCKDCNASQLAWSHKEGILNGLQDRLISTLATSSSRDISRATCTKRNQGQLWTWNRTSGTKWQQFPPPCCNEWCRTSRNACGNVLTTRDATSQTLYSGSEYCN